MRGIKHGFTKVEAITVVAVVGILVGQVWYNFGSIVNCFNFRIYQKAIYYLANNVTISEY